MRTTPSRRRWPTIAAGVTASLVLGTGYATGQTIEHQATLTGRIPANRLIVTVTEGPGEPRSIGSYALRVYDPAHPDLPYDRFIAGTARKRDGAVEELLFRDLDDDRIEEALVVVQSVGPGGYLSADAFRATSNGVTVAATVKGLEPNSDPVQGLRGNNQPHQRTVKTLPKGPRNGSTFIRRARRVTNEIEVSDRLHRRASQAHAASRLATARAADVRALMRAGRGPQSSLPAQPQPSPTPGPHRCRRRRRSGPGAGRGRGRRRAREHRTKHAGGWWASSSAFVVAGFTAMGGALFQIT